MSETHLSYAPGSWTLLSRSGRFLLVDATPTDPVVARLWGSLALADDLEGVLAGLAEDLPGAGFCLAEVRDGELLLARDGVTATLDGVELPSTPWPSTIRLPAGGGTLVASVGDEAPSARIPFESGVVTAGVLVLEQTSETVAVPEPEPEPVVAAVVIPGLETELVELPVLPELNALFEAEPTGPTVLAGRCPRGHLSGAYSPACRVCGDALEPQDPQTVPRPVLGSLVLTNGQTVVLDHGAVLGRAPRVPDDAEERPHLVNLATYGRDISRQHVEVLLRGWNVLVRDLGSANGTQLRHADGTVTRLEPGVLVPILPGASIDLAEVTQVRFEVDPQNG